MAAFDPDADLANDVAYGLMAQGYVSLFHRPERLEDTVRWLADHGYRVLRLPAHAWQLDADLHRDMAAALDFPGYYGANLDALNDCLGEVVAYRYGTTRDATGLVFVLDGYDRYAVKNPRTAQVVLDILAGHIRTGALVGHRILCLLRCDLEPEFDPVGGTPVTRQDP